MTDDEREMLRLLARSRATRHMDDGGTVAAVIVVGLLDDYDTLRAQLAELEAANTAWAAKGEALKHQLAASEAARVRLREALVDAAQGITAAWATDNEILRDRRLESTEAALNNALAADAGNERRKRWRVDFICCGRDDGHQFFDSWKTADALRTSYVKKLHTNDHERSAILTEDSGGYYDAGNEQGARHQAAEQKGTR